jgi:hypothetical protein
MNVMVQFVADFTFVGAYSRSGTPESDSDTERDEAQMAAEMVGTGILSEGEWSAIESEGSAHQGGVLEPAVSAALDFRAMLEAALRGPSLPCIYTILFYNILSVLFVRDYQWKVSRC